MKLHKHFSMNSHHLHVIIPWSIWTLKIVYSIDVSRNSPTPCSNLFLVPFHQIRSTFILYSLIMSNYPPSLDDSAHYMNIFRLCCFNMFFIFRIHFFNWWKNTSRKCENRSWVFKKINIIFFIRHLYRFVDR